uniref:SFRICE_020043 n=1 Tax=Spodoptera frugiperda TaxID=7108 RepID=A0A2H1VXM4_SPOFR
MKKAIRSAAGCSQINIMGDCFSCCCGSSGGGGVTVVDQAYSNDGGFQPPPPDGGQVTDHSMDMMR